MNEKALKNAVRLHAIERLVSMLIAAQCVQDAPESPQEALTRMRRAASEGAQKPSLPPGFDPVVSDLFSAELEVATDRLLGMAAQNIDALKSG